MFSLVLMPILLEGVTMEEDFELTTKEKIVFGVYEWLYGDDSMIHFVGWERGVIYFGLCLLFVGFMSL